MTLWVPPEGQRGAKWRGTVSPLLARSVPRAPLRGVIRRGAPAWRSGRGLPGGDATGSARWNWPEIRRALEVPVG